MPLNHLGLSEIFNDPTLSDLTFLKRLTALLTILLGISGKVSGELRVIFGIFKRLVDIEVIEYAR